MLRKTEDIVDKEEGCQDFAQLSPPPPLSISRARVVHGAHTDHTQAAHAGTCGCSYGPG